jgi:hypothetical protein
MAVASCLVVALLSRCPSLAMAPARRSSNRVRDDAYHATGGRHGVVTDANGADRLPADADSGAFAFPDVTPGRTVLTLETASGSFAVATAVTLAPGETRGVHLALKAGRGSKDAKGTTTQGGSGWSGGAIAGMTVVIVGFVAAAAVAIDQQNNENASPSAPAEK